MKKQTKQLRLSNPMDRSVTEDWLREQGQYHPEVMRWLTGLGPVVPLTETDANTSVLIADVDAAETYAADASADDACSDTDTDVYADEAAFADAHVHALPHEGVTDADAAESNTEETMRPGMHAVLYYQGGGRGVLRIGWFRLSKEYPGRLDAYWSSVYRDTYARLSPIWVGGPQTAPKTWQYGEPLTAQPLELHVMDLCELDASKWASVCPRPSWWGES